MRRKCTQVTRWVGIGLAFQEKKRKKEKEKKLCIYKKARVGNAPSLEFMLVLAISLCFFLRKKANILSVHRGKRSLTDEEERSERRLP